MNSKPENRIRTEDSMGPVGFEPTTASAPGLYLYKRWYPRPS